MEKIYADLVVARNTVTVDGHNATLAGVLHDGSL